MPQTIEVLFGPIASGKSTYASARAKDGAIVVNDDSIIMALHGGNYEMYDKDLKLSYKSVRSAIIHSAVQTGRDVVVDSTGLKQSTRDFIRLTAQTLDVKCALVIFREGKFLGEEDGIRRWRADSRGLSMQEWREIGAHHKNVHDPVTDKEIEQFDTVDYIEWDKTNRGVALIIDTYQAAIADMTETKELKQGE